MTLQRSAITCAVIAIACSSAACKSSIEHVAVVGPPDVVRVADLRREDYAVLGDAKARACRTVVSFWPIPLWIQFGESGFGLYGWVYNAEGDAWQKAIASQPEADAVVMPRSKKDERFAFWHHEVCYEVRAKAIHLKTDAERGTASTPAVLAPPIPPPP